MDKNKKWVISFIVVLLIFLVGTCAATVIIDPYFHYHKPLAGLQYPIYNQRYQNNGILKHFDYDAVIIGTSMTENFKASELNELFDVNSIKVPFSGASNKELNDNLAIAIQSNPGIKLIVRGLDYNRLLDSADAMRYDGDSYPGYLYDNIIWNDVKYFFNKTILFQDTYGVIDRTLSGETTTDFDSYSNWNNYFTFGKEAIDAEYVRAGKAAETTPITDEDYQNIEKNISQNVTELAKEHPEIEFYLFFTPYSIYFWDSLNQAGIAEQYLDAEKYVIELLLKYDNIHLFSFFTEYETICDLNNYKDPLHYSEDINSQILIWMKEGIHELTEENYEEYCAQMRAFYLNANYDSLFE